MSDANAQLTELFASYGRRLPARIAAVASAIERIADEAGALAEARMLAHRLAGNAGSFGYPDVGRAMAAIERALAVSPIDAAAIADALAAADRAAAAPPLTERP